MTRLFVPVLGLVLAGLAISPANAQPYYQGIVLQEQIYLSDFTEDVVYVPMSCAQSCLETVVERTRFECSQMALPPVIGCDLPSGIPEWINPTSPTPLPWAGGLSAPCILEPQPGPFRLKERRQLVKQHVQHHSDCTSTVTETVLQNLPLTGEAPDECPGGAIGAWTSIEEVPVSVDWVACPE